MYYYPFNQWRQMIFFDNSSYYILDYKQGDVNGDGFTDNVYLMGDKPFGEQSPFADNITLVVLDGKTGIFKKIQLKANAGYKPTIFLGDFDGNGVADILVNIDSGGSGGYMYSYVYSYYNNQPRLLFDFEEFNREYKYEVNYMDYYKVEVISKNLNKTFILDISRKDKEYLAGIYDEDGKLKTPVNGDVTALVGVYPIDLDRNGVFELLAIQRIAGLYNADTLGLVQTYLEWDGSGFVPFNQYAAISSI